MSHYGSLARLASRIPETTFTRPRNRRLWEWMNANAVGKRVLNLGSGVGRLDSLLSPEVRPVNLDFDPRKPWIAVVTDAYDRPFQDRSFVIVYSIAVLEHVKTRGFKAAWTVVKGHASNPLQHLDVHIYRSGDLRRTANSFTYIGRFR